MNKFAKYTRSTAFTITMHELAIHDLLFLDAMHTIYVETGRTDYGMELNRSMTSYLDRRGLIEPVEDPTCAGNVIPSSAGIALAKLLREAGFTSFMDKEVADRIDQYHKNFSHKGLSCQPSSTPETSR